MDEITLQALGRQTIIAAVEREHLIKALIEAQAKVRELTPKGDAD